ncbi:sporulation YhaL family protein [Alteribacillus iranensis]|uniref:Sporulation protein YhaL n=1 Tax=Alteribacillus iranensis TaxID=930128 RepID=A0A1I1Z443_9BACI|nr:sporulation YhaL family protein [Alteribacillus iranensis]SFE26437.1 Sporulation protein YhaL [Alteribacillus iranensis]
MNNRSKKLLMTLVVLFFGLVVWQRFMETSPVQAPAWVLLAVLGIIFSGYMWRQTSKSEKKEEENWIEQEGRIFIRRMEAERKRREEERGRASS